MNDVGFFILVRQAACSAYLGSGLSQSALHDFIFCPLLVLHGMAINNQRA